jgi:hypothetical protein
MGPQVVPLADYHNLALSLQWEGTFFITLGGRGNFSGTESTEFPDQDLAKSGLEPVVEGGFKFK